MHISFESPDQADVHLLLGELDTYLYALYPADKVYALDTASLLHASVRFAVIRDSGGAALGCGAIVIKAAYGEIKRIYVRPSARGQGLARRLIEALEANAAAEGCPLFMLETGPAQAEACILYERLGYRQRGPFGEYMEDAHSVFMQKAAPAVPS